MIFLNLILMSQMKMRMKMMTNLMTKMKMNPKMAAWQIISRPIAG